MKNRDTVGSLLLVSGAAAILFFLRLYRKAQERDEDMARLMRNRSAASDVE